MKNVNAEKRESREKKYYEDVFQMTFELEKELGRDDESARNFAKRIVDVIKANAEAECDVSSKDTPKDT